MSLPPVKPFNPNTPNDAIMNAVRKNASVEYQRRIPDTTKANIEENVRTLLGSGPLRNEFIDALVNRIGAEIFRINSWTNPMAKFKGGMLEFGDTIEEIMVGLLNARVYDPNRPALEQELFGLHSPEVQTSFHKVNRENYYAISINDSMLRRAFLSDTGLSSMMAQLMEAPTKSDQWDEFLAMVRLFAEYEKAGGFFKVNAPDLANVASSDAPQAKHFLKMLRAWAGNLSFLSRNYNAAGLPVAAKPEELVLFVTPEANATMDVDGLSAAFQIEKADVPYRIQIIPQQHFGIPGVQAVLTTDDFFVVRDTLFETRNQPNAASLHTNYFVHHHQIISASRFVPAVLFWTGEGDTIPTVETPVTGITPITAYDENGEDVTSLTRGDAYQIRAAAITEGDNSAVTLEIVSNTTSSFTRITRTGILFIGLNEEESSITVRATATDTDYPQMSAEQSFDIVGDLIRIWPNPGEESDEDADGLFEATPADLGEVDGKVTIPSITGVQYRKDGVNVANKTVHEITTEVTFDAVARQGYELTPGTHTWAFGA